MKQRATKISEAIAAWLSNEDGLLEQSVTRTIEAELFPYHDVAHMLDQVAQSVTGTTLTRWTEKADSNIRNHITLCLHAGNLPMVGLQDLVATLLSGGCYYGKLSRKDPWLMDGLLRVIRKRLPAQVGQWHVQMDELAGIRADNILFAGSEGSVKAVTRRCHHQNLADANTRFLYRTARFSMAWLTEQDFDSQCRLRPNVCRLLIEAMLRYEGRGCRSVAVIVAPHQLMASADVLQEGIERFHEKNPPSRAETPGAGYWKSYLRSMERPVIEAGPLTLTDDPEMAGREDMISWLSDSETESKVRDIAQKFGRQLQQVYVTDPAKYQSGETGSGESQSGETGSSESGLGESQPGKTRFEATQSGKTASGKEVFTGDGPVAGFLRLDYLRCAQSPPIDWQPDGVDVLEWLQSESSP